MEYIDRLILRLCKQPRTFEFISINLNGYDPVDLHTNLKNLELKKQIKNVNGLWCVNDIKDQNSKIDISSSAKTRFFNEHIGFFGLFKKPHPLDFEWRNSTASLDYLIQKVQEICSVSDKCLFLGFPTLFATACIRNIPQNVTLVEKNKPIVTGLSKLNPDRKRFQIIESDIFSTDPKTMGHYYCVIMDPPWYSSHFYQFVWLAAQCVDIGGIIGISLPPINTRPKISQERIEWLDFCERNGLCLENLYSQRLHYAMPFFEFNAFRAAGIKDILPFWRTGDFALFRKVHNGTTVRPKINEEPNKWVEKEIETVRIRIRLDEFQKTNSDLKINSLIKGDILPSVSTRDERRNKANLWTSGNRIYNINAVEKFINILNKFEQNYSKDKDRKLVTEFVRTIIEIENKEYNNYLDWLYHEMERQID